MGKSHSISQNKEKCKIFQEQSCQTDEITLSYQKIAPTKDWETFLPENEGIVIKLQAIWRGSIARKTFRTPKDSHNKSVDKKGNSDPKYFKSEDESETIQKGKVYNFDQPRVIKKYTYKSGAVYEGEWKGGFRDGIGTQKWPDGATYEGSWRFNKAEGKGKFTHADGDIYEGDWANDKANGFGVYNRNNEATYHGHWKNDLQDGKGIERWTDNSEHEGEYQKGKKHGYGVHKWNDGSIYEGQWEDNKMCGVGIYKFFDGRKYRGEWKDNNMEGHGFYIWRDGKKYQGQYKDDKKHGYGIHKWADGRTYEGSWALGKQHGLGRYLCSGTVKYGLWEEGARIKWFNQQEVKRIKNGDDSWFKQNWNQDLLLLSNKRVAFGMTEGVKKSLEKVAIKIGKMDQL
ncbi:unnamed protein product [Moneuplotes crassus]|uniref:MORN repeat protein n=1 Tax=Euplotes crassus TaxID=5936 RepID=A0AAD1UQB0_EUPCR|nr:unnamed protein product [Moneuplotes crassus]